MNPTARRIGQRVAAAATTALAIMIIPTPSWADTGTTGRDFGEHVVHCAQTMGFTGDHNPGMHHGFAGFDPTHTC
jgi:hypothetical protein